MADVNKTTSDSVAAKVEEQLIPVVTQVQELWGGFAKIDGSLTVRPGSFRERCDNPDETRAGNW